MKTKELEGMDQLKIIDTNEVIKPKIFRNIRKAGYSWSDLIKAVAKESGYHAYEVKEILTSFVDVATIELLANRVVRIDRIGQLEPKMNDAKFHYNIITGIKGMSAPKNKVKWSISSTLNNQMNPKDKHDKPKPI